MADDPLFPHASRIPERVTQIIANRDDRLAEVSLVTVHFNPCRYDRLRATYYEWLPTLGSLADSLRCYELVFDDDEPEIDGSIVIRGSRELHWMWQKESMINRALRDTPKRIKYFGWLDHDIVITNPDWLSIAIDKIDSCAVAVQCFDSVKFIDLAGNVIRTNPGAMSQWANHGKTDGSPGGAWIADRYYLDSIGGLNATNVVGGGDQAWYYAAIGQVGAYATAYGPAMARDQQEWITNALLARDGRRCDYLPFGAYHLWHGDREDRQYQERYAILAEAGFDPAVDIEVNSDGLAKWSGASAAVRNQVREYFDRRREDG